MSSNDRPPNDSDSSSDRDERIRKDGSRLPAAAPLKKARGRPKKTNVLSNRRNPIQGSPLDEQEEEDLKNDLISVARSSLRQAGMSSSNRPPDDSDSSSDRDERNREDGSRLPAAAPLNTARGRRPKKSVQRSSSQGSANKAKVGNGEDDSVREMGSELAEQESEDVRNAQGIGARNSSRKAVMSSNDRPPNDSDSSSDRDERIRKDDSRSPAAAPLKRARGRPKKTNVLSNRRNPIQGSPLDKQEEEDLNNDLISVARSSLRKAGMPSSNRPPDDSDSSSDRDERIREDGSRSPAAAPLKTARGRRSKKTVQKSSSQGSADEATVGNGVDDSEREIGSELAEQEEEDSSDALTIAHMFKPRLRTALSLSRNNPDEEHWTAKINDDGSHNCVICHQPVSPSKETHLIECDGRMSTPLYKPEGEGFRVEPQESWACTSKFHRDCIEAYTVGDFCYQDGAQRGRHLCPLHYCNTCNSRGHRDWASLPTLIECTMCLRSFHFDCLPAGACRLLVAIEGDGEPRKFLMMTCPAHRWWPEEVEGKGKKELGDTVKIDNIKGADPPAISIRENIEACMYPGCERIDSQLQECKTCVRSYHPECVRAEKFNGHPVPDDTCEFCFRYETIPIDILVLVYTVNCQRFYIAKTREWSFCTAERVPQKDRIFFGKPGYTLVEWIYQMSESTFSVIPVHLMAPLRQSWLKFGREANDHSGSFWENTFESEKKNVLTKKLAMKAVFLGLLTRHDQRPTLSGRTRGIGDTADAANNIPNQSTERSGSNQGLNASTVPKNTGECFSQECKRKGPYSKLDLQNCTKCIRSFHPECIRVDPVDGNSIPDDICEFCIRKQTISIDTPVVAYWEKGNCFWLAITRSWDSLSADRRQGEPNFGSTDFTVLEWIYKTPLSSPEMSVVPTQRMAPLIKSYFRLASRKERQFWEDTLNSHEKNVLMKDPSHSETAAIDNENTDGQTSSNGAERPSRDISLKTDHCSDAKVTSGNGGNDIAPVKKPKTIKLIQETEADIKRKNEEADSYVEKLSDVCNKYPEELSELVTRPSLVLENLDEKQLAVTGHFTDEVKSCVICHREVSPFDNNVLIDCHGQINSEKNESQLIEVAMRPFIACRSKFHQDCIEKYNSGNFEYSKAARANWKRRLLCPLHCCNDCKFHGFQEMSYKAILFECSLCLRSFCPRHYPAGGRDLDVTIDIDGENRTFSMMICPAHIDNMLDENSRNLAIINNVKDRAGVAPPVTIIEKHLEECSFYFCRVEKQPLYECKKCVRSFHARCVRVKKVNGECKPNDTCGVCIRKETIALDNMVAAYCEKSNMFYLAVARPWHSLPATRQQEEPNFSKHGYTVVEWMYKTPLSSPEMSVVPIHQVVYPSEAGMVEMKDVLDQAAPQTQQQQHGLDALTASKNLRKCFSPDCESNGPKSELQDCTKCVRSFHPECNIVEPVDGNPIPDDTCGFCMRKQTISIDTLVLALWENNFWLAKIEKLDSRFGYAIVEWINKKASSRILRDIVRTNEVAPLIPSYFSMAREGEKHIWEEKFELHNGKTPNGDLLQEQVGQIQAHQDSQTQHQQEHQPNPQISKQYEQQHQIQQQDQAAPQTQQQQQEPNWFEGMGDLGNAATAVNGILNQPIEQSNQGLDAPTASQNTRKCFSPDCESNGPKSELQDCTKCVRSFHPECNRVEPVDGTPIPDDTCEFCIRKQTISIDTLVIALWANRFWLAKMKDWDDFPPDHKKEAPNFGKNGFSVIEWITKKASSRTLLDIVPTHQVAPLIPSYFSLAKKTEKQFWEETFELHNGKTQNGELLQKQAGQIQAHQDSQTQHQQWQQPNLQISEQYEQQHQIQQQDQAAPQAQQQQQEPNRFEGMGDFENAATAVNDILNQPTEQSNQGLVAPTAFKNTRKCFSPDCESNGPKSELQDCTKCVRSFHPECNRVEPVDGTPIPDDTCEFCIRKQTISIDTLVIAPWANRFWLAKMKDWDDFPPDHKQEAPNFGKQGFSVVEWITKKASSRKLFNIVPTHQVAPLIPSYFSLAKKTEKQFWVETFELHNGKTQNGDLLQEQAGQIQAHQDSQIQHQQRQQPNLQTSEQYEQQHEQPEIAPEVQQQQQPSGRGRKRNLVNTATAANILNQPIERSESDQGSNSSSVSTHRTQHQRRMGQQGVTDSQNQLSDADNQVQTQTPHQQRAPKRRPRQQPQQQPSDIDESE